MDTRDRTYLAGGIAIMAAVVIGLTIKSNADNNPAPITTTAEDRHAIGCFLHPEFMDDC